MNLTNMNADGERDETWGEVGSEEVEPENWNHNLI